MTNTKNCPECCVEMPVAARVCHACGERLIGKPCPECAELSKENARRCRHCGHDFSRSERTDRIEAFNVKAAFLPTFLIRMRLIPQEIHLTPEKIVIRTWGVFRLSHTDEDIPWEKIAGYHYRSGWFWDGIEIQTRGQKANAIGSLPKTQALRIKNALEQMKE